MNPLENDLNSFIAVHLQELITEKGLTPINCLSEGLGSLVDYQCPDLVLRVVNDKGQIFLEVKPIDTTASFFDLGRLREIFSKTNYDAANDFGINDAQFLRDQWDDVAAALKPAAYEQTMQQTLHIGYKRIKEIFPDFEIPTP